MSVVAVRLVCAAGEQLLVVVGVVLLVEACRQTEICQLDVAASVEKDVVGLDVTGRVRIFVLVRLLNTYRCMKPSLWTASIASVISAM